MITELTLENFKAFQKPTVTTIAPITVLCGANSSGKSSVIQSLLLLKQTLESPMHNRTLLLNSRFVRMGSAETFIHGRDLTRSFRLAFTIEIPSSDYGSNWSGRFPPFSYLMENLNFGLPENKDSSRRTKSTPARLFVDVDYVLRANSQVTGQEELYVEEATFVSRAVAGSREHQGFKIALKRTQKNQYQVNWTGATGGRWRQLPENGNSIIPLTFVNLYPDVTRFEEGRELHPLRYYFQDIHWLMRKVFDSLSYIGPLREEPSRRYLYDNEVLEIGLKGEYAPFILAAQGPTKVRPFFVPEDKKWIEYRNKSLSEALEVWLRYMEISPTITSQITKGVLDLNLKASMTSDLAVSYADVGFGVSQILPILIEGLRLAPGQALVLEQPEIHLHPRLALRLADFFIGMAKAGKRVIVETHSDHIVNRLVRRVVEDESDALQNSVNVLFVEPTAEGSVVRRVEIHPDKGIINWPKDFFDQTASEQEEIIKAGIDKRKKKRVTTKTHG